uniref:Uncharacterized protein n=1 Tax=Panagrellus redivivus TaxID=6233 RepID=A0A7E4VAJ4_PANRE
MLQCAKVCIFEEGIDRLNYHVFSEGASVNEPVQSKKKHCHFESPVMTTIMLRNHDNHCDRNPESVRVPRYASQLMREKTPNVNQYTSATRSMPVMPISRESGYTVTDQMFLT